jgi:putative peptidoglycan lipid II flippase
VTFLKAPREEDYGTVAVFVDPYGNKWDLVQPRGIDADGSWRLR